MSELIRDAERQVQLNPLSHPADPSSGFEKRALQDAYHVRLPRPGPHADGWGVFKRASHDSICFIRACGRCDARAAVGRLKQGMARLVPFIAFMSVRM